MAVRVSLFQQAPEFAWRSPVSAPVGRSSGLANRLRQRSFRQRADSTPVVEFTVAACGLQCGQGLYSLERSTHPRMFNKSMAATYPKTSDLFRESPRGLRAIGSEDQSLDFVPFDPRQIEAKRHPTLRADVGRHVIPVGMARHEFALTVECGFATDRNDFVAVMIVEIYSARLGLSQIVVGYSSA
jgi:hypothetical protein